MSTLDWSRLRVLVIDDNAFFRKVVRTVLSAAGVTHIVEAVSAEDALDRFWAEDQIDLILLDYVMGPTDGLTLTRMIRRSPHSANTLVPIIMVSGHLNPTDVQLALNAGVNAVVGKPISARDLLKAIKRTLTEPVAFIRSNTYFGPDHRRRGGGDVPVSDDGTPVVIDVREE
ncbi:response regulator [uncultured Rhodospira sp.]|uniref:response regulator n=1 Tax=uncultured Rhodospira sp. TaxID=1936189 RepID=UPI0026318C49|nr:response regulator [uncultured Rhodospira sp.]